ncbi:MAG: type II secretion system protein [Dechloromonas sp.]|nr:type II secretion system protein [Dechloromonas sp.]
MRLIFRSRQEGGFSYVGLLILVGVVGAMFAATVTTGALMQRRLAEEELLFIGTQFRNAFKTYYESTPPGGKPYPQQLSDLLLDPRTSLSRRHLRHIFPDPLTGKAEWGTVAAPGGGIIGVYSLSSEKPIKAGGFDPDFESCANKSKYSEWVFQSIPEVSSKSSMRN